MELLVHIDNKSKESDISRIMKFLKSQNCVSKMNLIKDDMKTIEKISDKTTINSIHQTSSKALEEFLENENESIF